MTNFVIEDKTYSLRDIYRFITDKPQLALSESIQFKICNSRNVLESLVQEGKIIYGVNTGFGKLSQVKISEDQITTLQRNLILSHAVGIGDPIPDDLVRLIMILKVIGLSKGFSGIRLEVVHHILELLNRDCLPIIPEQGSVGASGDLAPLAHLTLAMIGEDKVKYKGEIVASSVAYKEMGIEPIILSYKEGLALINGTQFSTAYGVLCMLRLTNLLKIADIAGALSVESMLCTDTPFQDRVQKIKPHQGQIDCGENLINLLNGSQIQVSHADCERVQDLYSTRCMPQVHGACRETISAARKMIETETISVSDNPLIFCKEKDSISAGHFHAETVGQAMDIAAIAVVDLGNMSERRLYSLVNGDFGLPPFLVKDSGINSGFMIVQVSAAAIASENKTLAHPATIDSIPTGAGQEDHVSMAPWAGRKLLKSIENAEIIFAMEIMAACQAIDFRDGLKSSLALENVIKRIRKNVKFLETDRFLQPDIIVIASLIRSGELVSSVEKYITLK